MEVEEVIDGTYEIVNGVVDVFGSVDISSIELTEIPWKFGTVTVDFACYNNKLTSLRYCPSYVGRNFLCEDNRLTSLEFCPSYVGGNFSCHNNKITSLKNCQADIRGQISCSNNPIKSFKNVPLSILLKIKDTEYFFDTLIITPIPSEYFDKFIMFMKKNMELKKVRKKVSIEERLRNI